MCLSESKNYLIDYYYKIDKIKKLNIHLFDRFELVFKLQMFLQIFNCEYWPFVFDFVGVDKLKLVVSKFNPIFQATNVGTI